MSESAFNLPEDLTGLTAEELAALSERARTEFDGIYSAESGPQASDVARAAELADAIDALSGEVIRRDTEAAETRTALDSLRARVDAHVVVDQAADTTDSVDAEAAVAEATAVEAAVDTTSEPQLVTASTTRPKTQVEDVLKSSRPKLNPSLAAAQRQAPNPRVPERKPELVITAAAATSGAPIGTRFADINQLGAAINQYSRGMAVSHGNPSYVPFVSIRNEFAHVLDERTDPKDVERVIKTLTDPEVLVAAGGWCAPSEIRYDFFNIACDARDGMVDLPTFGVSRGGIRFPVSPSMADVFTGTITNATNPWLWTEADDILAATGSPTKPCVRVPCPSFSEARLECFGICVTAGNLTDNAYPEATRNYLSLLMSAHMRAMNTRFLAQMVALSSAAIAIGAAGAGTAAPLLGGVEMAAIDYRTRYGMCQTAILEVILPIWAKGVIRSDLAKRTGIDLLAVTDAMIGDWFDLRGVRVQFVNDWQVRTDGTPGFSSAITAWPTSVDFLIYAAGTFAIGNGMSLDLGVVRDSTLNSTNDFTAGWSEECHLVARFGHESRRYTVAICTDGTTGAADLTACGL